MSHGCPASTIDFYILGFFVGELHTEQPMADFSSLDVFSKFNSYGLQTQDELNNHQLTWSDESTMELEDTTSRMLVQPQSSLFLRKPESSTEVCDDLEGVVRTSTGEIRGNTSMKSTTSDNNHASKIDVALDTDFPGMLSTKTALLLSSYTDRVVPSWCPLGSSTRSRIGHTHPLQFLVFSSKPFLKLSILLSETYHDIEVNNTPSSSPDIWNIAMDTLEMLPSSLAVLSLLNQERKMSQILVACSCILQVIHLDVRGDRFFSVATRG